jgi:dipeptidyl aminopeptidase/acylaminoacyl peptidase
MRLMKSVMFLWILLLPCLTLLWSQEPVLDELTVEKIMRDPKWIGTSPSEISWSADGQWIYFKWNPENVESDSLYAVSRDAGTIRKLTREERLKMPARYGSYNRMKSKKLYAKNGDIFVLNIINGETVQLTNTVDRESSPRFTHDQKKITYTLNENLYLLKLADGSLEQLTNFRKGDKKSGSNKDQSINNKWLKAQQLELFNVLRTKKHLSEAAEKNNEKEKPKRPVEIYIQKKSVRNLQLGPDERYITFRLINRASREERTIVPNYITESGYTEEIAARTKVGSQQSSYEFGIYDTHIDSVYYVNFQNLPGIDEGANFLPKSFAANKKNQKKEKTLKAINIYGPYWSEDGEQAAGVVLSLDNKDRWIVLFDFTDGSVKSLDHQHDDAWIGGPGISRWRFSEGVGWLPDNEHFWFHSEETGFSHIYSVNVLTVKKKAITEGEFEIYKAIISRDKKYWYFSSNQVHPGERHFYRMPIDGGEMIRLTHMKGRNDVYLSPDESKLAIRYSYSNKPWELYVKENNPEAEAKRVTFSLSAEFESYPWREPEIITFPASDGAQVHARLYQPRVPVEKGPAVVFVHGAGYMQNVHRWWSSYFREYMFNNLLADNGYTVLDIDYRGSAGYGRDWRTAIYRNMGGKDLSDQVDGVRYLIENYQVDPERVGIYGGSYGGFITLMAMFTAPQHFRAGAALRAVTDWAHYNHPYTSNILNIPQSDSLAFVKSSPIYFAQGLQGALLICHGMIDVNVHFQDIVRLAQRFIELGKDNWELAVYPLEGHSFKEASSWTDEYKRIFKLFEANLRQ